MEITKFFRIQRKKHIIPISQEEIAKVIGIDRVSYSQFELGLRKLKLEEFVKLCDLWELDYNILKKLTIVK